MELCIQVVLPSISDLMLQFDIVKFPVRKLSDNLIAQSLVVISKVPHS